MIDNFEQIKGLLKFNSDDDFYFCQILKRKKEHKELGSNSYVVKTYFIKSEEDLEFYKAEMINLAEFHNARVYLNLNKRSFERTAFHTLKKITDQILNKDYKSARKAYASVCGMYAADQDKTWVIDVDEPKGRQGANMLKFIDNIEPVGNKLIAIVDTKNGYHIISKPFNIQKFSDEYPTIDIHKQNPTILYIP